VQRALEKLSGSCLQKSNNQPYSQQGQKTLVDSSPELYCIDLAEAYVTREKCQFEDLGKKKGMICNRPMDICTKKVRKERRNGERMLVLILVPGSHERLSLRKCLRFARNMGAHVRHGIRSTKGMKTG
jgi:hypothetical protein